MWVWFAFLLWIEMLSIFLYAYWPFIYLLWRIVYSNPLFIFNWILLLLTYGSSLYILFLLTFSYFIYFYLIFTVFFPLPFSTLVSPSPQQSAHCCPCPWVLFPFCSNGWFKPLSSRVIFYAAKLPEHKFCTWKWEISI